MARYSLPTFTCVVTKIRQDNVDKQGGYRRRDVEICADPYLPIPTGRGRLSIELLQASSGNLSDIDFALDLGAEERVRVSCQRVKFVPWFVPR
jgi:hypothetical protein